MTHRRWALPLVPLYRAALALKRKLAPAPKSLTWPVISIGSLSAGGAGKTPIVIALANLLTEHGWHTDILTRGYGRSGTATERVNHTLLNAATRFGDEPNLLAQRTSSPVWVGSNRHTAGQLAEAQSPTASKALHLLDDGFQHHRLARTLDIVLLTAEDLADTLLPAGNLRETLSALARADIVLIREDESQSGDLQKSIWPYLREGAQLWTIRRTLHFPAPLFVFGAGLKPIAFCALARPDDFAASLTSAGCGIVETLAFPDHHRYTAADIQRLLTLARSLNATGFVTTEKDAVKLTPAHRTALEAHGPLMIVSLTADFLDPDFVLRYLEKALEKKLEKALEKKLEKALEKKLDTNLETRRP